jgi:hypothetical protein
MGTDHDCPDDGAAWKSCNKCGTPSSFAADKGNGVCRNCWAPDYLASVFRDDELQLRQVNPNTEASFRLEGREVPADYVRSERVQEYIDADTKPGVTRWGRPTPARPRALQRGSHDHSQHSPSHHPYVQ